MTQSVRPGALTQSMGTIDDVRWLIRFGDYSDDDIEFFTERVAIMLEEHPQPHPAQIQFARREARRQLWKKNGQRRIA